jgi:vacuolar-type H+-ATPase subunit C/Vma6
MTAIAARARGLTATLVAEAALVEIDRAPDASGLAAALTRAGIACPAGVTGERIDRLAGARVAADLAILERWTDRLAPVALDEDRRTLRAIVRGLAAGVAGERRLAGAVPTARLPAARLAELAACATVGELAAALARHDHPYAAAVAAARAPIDLLELELALAHRWAALARSSDRAMASYLAQVVDAENTAGALVLASGRHDLAPERAWLPGGDRLGRAGFLAAAAGPLDATRAALAAAFAGTPLAAAVFAAEPAALEDAALAWQLATQARLRRREPLGLAPALYAVLRRRGEARRLRRAAWRIALGGPP